MTLLDVSITNVALPAIGESTGAGPATLQWIVSGYTLSFGLVPVLAGRLGDDHGRRRLFLIGVTGFVVTSALSGLAPGAGVLVAARVLQGLSGGLINPQVSGLVQQMFRGGERGRAFGVIGAVVGVGTALGPLVGGALIALGGPDLGWRLVFFVNVPIGLVVIALARRWLPGHPETAGASSSRRHRLDIAGAVMLGLATFCVLFAAVEYDVVHDLSLAWLAVPAVVLLVTFFRREARLTRERSDPLIDLRLFRQPSYTVGVLLALVFFCGMTGLPLVLALYYQQGLGYTALQSGLGVTAFALGTAVAAPLAGRVVTRIGRPLVVGACMTFGLGALSLDLVARQEPGTHGSAGLCRAVVHYRSRVGCRHHPQPDFDAGGRRSRDGQHGRRCSPDRAADRIVDRSGGDRGSVLRRAARGSGRAQRLGAKRRVRPRTRAGRAGHVDLRPGCGGVGIL